MKYLLDTHTLLWYRLEPNKLSEVHRLAISASDKQKYISTISIWEISLKFGLGKLGLNGHTPEEFVTSAVDIGFQIIQPEVGNFASFHRLPNVLKHKDPFDRMLIWQALNQDLVLLSHDTKMATYKIHGLTLG